MRKATITLEGPSIFAGDDTVENAAGFFADLFRPLANIGVTISYDELKSQNGTIVLDVCIE